MFYKSEESDAPEPLRKGESACMHCAPWGATGYVTKRDGRQTVCTGCDGTGIKGKKPTEIPARILCALTQRDETP